MLEADSRIIPILAAGPLYMDQRLTRGRRAPTIECVLDMFDWDHLKQRVPRRRPVCGKQVRRRFEVFALAIDIANGERDVLGCDFLEEEVGRRVPLKVTEEA